MEAGGDPGPLGEDCLYLNVWTRKASAGAKLPVMVWIHGGALVIGAASVPFYYGAALALRGVVLVTDGRLLQKTLEFGDPIAVRDNFMALRLDAYIGVLNLMGTFATRN